MIKMTEATMSTYAMHSQRIHSVCSAASEQGTLPMRVMNMTFCAAYSCGRHSCACSSLPRRSVLLGACPPRLTR